mmetsp:Transcript_120238/g.340721  ORF Transcript_120238/g.340721 Transcript_120238/m.340721 type:complete len:306 (-) Transcript_120238:127-1044(-)
MPGGTPLTPGGVIERTGHTPSSPMPAPLPAPAAVTGRTPAFLACWLSDFTCSFRSDSSPRAIPSLACMHRRAWPSSACSEVSLLTAQCVAADSCAFSVRRSRICASRSASSASTLPVGSSARRCLSMASHSCATDCLYCSASCTARPLAARSCSALCSKALWTSARRRSSWDSSPRSASAASCRRANCCSASSHLCRKAVVCFPAATASSRQRSSERRHSVASTSLPLSCSLRASASTLPRRPARSSARISSFLCIRSWTRLRSRSNSARTSASCLPYKFRICWSSSTTWSLGVLLPRAGDRFAL